MTDDIVARLRLWSDNAKEQDATDIVVGLCAAADEIERLRAELVSTTNKLTAERDEARRELCEADTDTHGGALLYADHRGWNCFKDGKP